MKINNLLIIYFPLLISCMNQDKSCHEVNLTDDSQPVVQFIRADTSNSWSNIHNIRQLGIQLKLEPVGKGFDSLQIRVWFDHSLAYKKHLIVLEKSNNEWNGRLYEMNVSYVDTLDYNIIEDFKKKNIKPKSGWKKLISDLDQLAIWKLSDTSQNGAATQRGWLFQSFQLNRDRFISSFSSIREG